MRFSLNECVVKHWLPCSLVSLLGVLCCCGSSTIDYWGGDEECVVVVLFLVVIGTGFVLVVGFSRVRYVVCSCVVGWVVMQSLSLSRVGCLGLLKTTSRSFESHFEPDCAVVSQVVSRVRSLLSRSVLVGCTRALMSSHLLPVFLASGTLSAWLVSLQLETSFVQCSSWCLAIVSACFKFILLCLRSASTCCQQVICCVRCSHYVVDPWFQFVFWLVVWNFVEGGVALCVVAAFFLLVGVLGVGFSRVERGLARRRSRRVRLRDTNLISFSSV